MAVAVFGPWLAVVTSAQDVEAPPRARSRPAASESPASAGVQPLTGPPERAALAPAPGAVDPHHPVPAAPAAGPVALVGGTIHTVSGERIERGTLVMDGGRIVAIGRDLTPPAGARIVDVSGRHVFPSLFHASTVLGLTEIGAVRATADMNEVGEMNPNARAEVAVDPDSELLPVTRSNGVLLAVTGGRGGVLSGTAALLELDGWTYRDMTHTASAALLLNWPGMRLDRSSTARTPLEKQQRALDESIARIRDSFETARAYLKGRAAEGDGAPRKDHDVKWESMAKAVRGEMPVVVRAGSVLEIQAALAFAREQNLRLVIEGGTDTSRVAGELARRKVAVIASNVLDVGRPWEPYDVNFTTPLKLHEAGVEFCIAPSGDSWNARNLPYVAAKAASYGLPADIALKAITLYPARIFGVADRLGSLEVGKDATLFVSTGDPLDIRSQVERAFVRGRELDLADRHKRLYERWRLKPRRAGGNP